MYNAYCRAVKAILHSARMTFPVRNEDALKMRLQWQSLSKDAQRDF